MIKILLLILILFIFNLSYSENFTSYFGYNKKTSLNKPLKNAIKTNKLNFSSLQNANLYIPLSYTHDPLLNKKNINENKSIFYINGCDNIVSKSKLWDHINYKYGRNKASTIMPETFIYKKNNDIKIFKKKYIPKKLYILKNKLQRKKGLYLTDNYDFIINGKNNGYTVIQNYIHDAFTINNRKLNIRLYFVIICYKNIFQCHLYNNGKCIYTNNDYDYDSIDLHSHITSLDLNTKIYEINPLTIKDLSSYMSQKKLNFKKLWNNIISNIKNIIHATKHTLYTDNEFKNNLSFQIFGPDVIIDTKLNTYIVEINKGPSMKSVLTKDFELKNNLYLDTFKLIKIFCEKNKINKSFNHIYGNENNFTQIY